jgi:hypothetical protein
MAKEMHLRGRAFGTVLVILLFISMAIGSQWAVTADPQTQEGSQTTIGAPAQITITAEEDDRAPMASVITI